MTAGDRLLAWAVTGPVGRVVAFFGDLAVYWWRRSSGRSARSQDR